MDAWLRRQSPAALLVAGLGVIAGVGYVDVATGPELTPILGYLLPIVPVAWYAGTRPAAILAGAGALAALLAEVFAPGGHVHGLVLVWNAAMRLAELLLVAWLVARWRAADERARELERTDPLTGAVNVRALYGLAAVEIARARRYRHPFTVAFIDLDEFKVVNDRLGHGAGDAVLRTVARALSAVLRVSDVVARVGGDEFVVLLPETGTAPARLAIEKLRQAIAGIVPAHGWRLTASIGVATYLVPPESVDALVGIADQLMFVAKQNGKNAVNHETRNEAPALP
ncbi:MAG: GGDEF domain-containing protein [Gemmatimonadetes bacterium]|nr:MAG: GGDEF domain-containing protein [Gemmatimonadota bacterium]